MFRVLLPIGCAGVLAIPAPAVADQPKTVEGALAAVERIADCPGCDYDLPRGAKKSARRGLASIAVIAPEGGGYAMLMAYTGSRWGRLWEGNGSTQNVERLPGKTVICMTPGGWTNVRSGPGLNYRRVGKVSRPTVKKVFEARLTKPLGKTDGEAWFRISYNGRPAWVQNLRTIAARWFGKTAAESCNAWGELYN